MKYLYVHGSNHEIAAQCVNEFICAGDDPVYKHLHSNPHPDNESFSWAKQLSDLIKMPLILDAKANYTVDNIIQSTTDHIESFSDHLVIIGWNIVEPSNLLHRKIWEFHRLLSDKEIVHVFYNSQSFFDSSVLKPHNWGFRYFNAYTSSYSQFCSDRNCYANENGYFSKDAHLAWAKFLMKYLMIYKVL